METELFVHFAEIAGVFVGFGALISLRGAHLTDVHDVAYLKGVLAMGVWVMFAALVPIAVSRYGVHDHALWLSCALVALIVWVILLVAVTRNADFRVLNRSPELVDRYFPVVGLPLHLITSVSLILILLGVWRSVDGALYVTALAAGVVFAAYTLLASVISQKHEAGSDRDGA
ncbi:MAG: hypothetical protein WAO15_02250 [Mycobacterium sp.]